MIRAKKSLGQNFLTDAGVSRRIVDAVSPQQSDVILEIGPGLGALTRLLVERSGHVSAVEVDSRLAGELRRSITRDNLSIIEADALTVNWNEVARAGIESLGARGGDLHQTRVRVVANLPYYISTPIIERLIRLRGLIFDLTLMLQNEVVERITSGPGGREYGYLSAHVQYHCVATKLFEVPPSAFRPAPKVQSAIVRLVARDMPAVDVADEARFLALVRAAFAQRRKTILNNLKAATGALSFAQPVETALELAGIDSKRRAETLSLDDYAALYHSLYRH
ncbi:MAG TPA: 16S rRNA (adenine(1518)-N(6)/adenine(1519)-N(6))-dimethyltransferase RsmA [Blastocatellia bacterium]|nr:16S rRNA (adenine(1518)-N(6)/adenine(1519)-N(6))-dimethyltransferase RsmA [Blastocatellia bacterium]